METLDQRRTRMTANTRAYRLRHPERVKVSRKNVYNGRKRRAFELLGGAFCEACGCDELDFLEINHIDGGGAKEWRSRRASVHDEILSGKRATDDLNVLCRLCNAMDFLSRKNPEAAKQFQIRWEQFTGKTAILETNNKEIT